jgi:arylsulfatase
MKSSFKVPDGYSIIRFEFKREGITKGTGKLFIDGQWAGSLFMPRTLPFVLSVEGLDIGRDRLTPVSSNYPLPGFPFSGQIEKVVIKIHENPFFKRDSICININGKTVYL